MASQLDYFPSSNIPKIPSHTSSTILDASGRSPAPAPYIFRLYVVHVPPPPGHYIDYIESKLRIRSAVNRPKGEKKKKKKKKKRPYKKIVVNSTSQVSYEIVFKWKKKCETCLSKQVVMRAPRSKAECDKARYDPNIETCARSLT